MTTTVPDVVDERPDVAESDVLAAGLTVRIVGDVVDCDHLGTVSTQTPSAGTVVPLGTRVDLTIGKGPKPPAMCP